MNFAELFVRHRVFAYMLSAALLLFGLVGGRGIGVDRMPNMDTPLILVTTLSPGASPEVVDRSITNILESAFNAVSSIALIESISSPGVSQILIEFKLNKNIDIAFNEIQSKVNQVVNELPRDTEVPVVAKLNPNAMPVVWLVLQGDRSLPVLNDLAREKVKQALETIPGVGEVVVGGGRERKMRVDLDLERMAALQVSVDDVIAAFAREHIQLPGGYLVDGMVEKLLHLDLEYHSSEELEQLVVFWRGQLPVVLGDVARVSDGLEDMRSLARLNGVDGVAIAVRKVQDANTVEVARAIEKRLQESVNDALPDGVKLRLVVNEAVRIEGIVAALQSHILEGTLLAALVVWLFLLNLPATLIIATAIPVSLAAAIFFMAVNDYTFNLFTLSALLLLIGVVVDDAIVVLENIHRHRETGAESAVSAAIQGTREVVFPVLAASLTLVCIFASVIFMEGLIGVILRSFAVVVSVGVVASMFVSFSLTPALCASFLRMDSAVERGSGPLAWLAARQEGMVQSYGRAIRFALDRRISVMLVTLLIIAGSFSLFGQLSTEMFPKDDDSRFMILLEAPQGASIRYTEQKIAEVEDKLRAYPEIRNILSTVDASGAVNKASIKVLLASKAERNRSQDDIMALVRSDLASLAGAEVFVRNFSMLENFDTQPLMAYITGPELDSVAGYARQIFAQLQRYEAIGNVQLKLELEQPLLVFDVDRFRAHELGISTRQIGNTIRVLAGGADIAKYNNRYGDGERYDVRLAADRSEMASAADLQYVYLRGRDDQLVPLDAVTAIEEELGPASIARVNLRFGVGLASTPIMPLGDAIVLLRSISEEILPPGYDLVLYGESDKLEETAAGIVFVFVAGLALVYMVLASQFNSFLQPMLVMLAQPLAIVGGVVALWITGYSLNINSMIGLFLLVGLVSKNSILLVDLINRYRDQGLDTRAAILEACPRRMRPVLMTSLTIVLAMLPAALGVGEGAGQYAPLSVAVIGGVISSTALTLLVIPVAYSLLARWLGTRAAYA